MAGARGRLNQIVFPVIITWMMYSSSSGLADKDCTSEFQKLGYCLDFVTDVAPSPPAECCTSVSSVNTDAPVCLCLVNAPGGPSEAIPNLNTTRLEQLPALCNIPFNFATCSSAGATPPSPASSSPQLVGVPKAFILLSAAVAMLFSALWVH